MLRHINMAKEAREKEKAAETIRKPIRRAVDKGVSAKLVSVTVEEAMEATKDKGAGG
jgi:hypothetical protein